MPNTRRPFVPSRHRDLLIGAVSRQAQVESSNARIARQAATIKSLNDKLEALQVAHFRLQRSVDEDAVRQVREPPHVVGLCAPAVCCPTPACCAQVRTA